MSDVDSAQKVYKTYLMVDNFIEILMENEKSGANVHIPQKQSTRSA